VQKGNHTEPTFGLGRMHAENSQGDVDAAPPRSLRRAPAARLQQRIENPFAVLIRQLTRAFSELTGQPGRLRRTPPLHRQQTRSATRLRIIHAFSLPATLSQKLTIAPCQALESSHALDPRQDARQNHSRRLGRRPPETQSRASETPPTHRPVRTMRPPTRANGAMASSRSQRQPDRIPRLQPRQAMPVLRRQMQPPSSST
jgi:hypothetical protein